MLTTLLLLASATTTQAGESLLKCPGGTELIVTKSKSGHETYCGHKEKNGHITKMGPYVKFNAKGLRTHDAQYWDDKPIYRVHSTYNKNGKLVRRQILKDDVTSTVQILWNEVENAVVKIKAENYKTFEDIDSRINSPKYVPVKALPNAADAPVVDPSGKSAK